MESETAAAMALPPLPDSVVTLLNALNAPPRLIAHLALVHAIAHRLMDQVMARWPVLPINRQIVLLGAATHDIGKVLHRNELTGAGSQHERIGPLLLRAHGFAEEVARIACTHGQWHADPAPRLEDLLVALADAIWNGTRDETLEQTVGKALAAATGEDAWAVYLQLDDVLTELAEGAEQRLRWHASHPVSRRKWGHTASGAPSSKDIA